eukprot:3230647-Rhodomonas_salina.1
MFVLVSVGFANEFMLGMRTRSLHIIIISGNQDHHDRAAAHDPAPLLPVHTDRLGRPLRRAHGPGHKPRNVGVSVD